MSPPAFASSISSPVPQWLVLASLLSYCFVTHYNAPRYFNELGEKDRNPPQVPEPFFPEPFYSPFRPCLPRTTPLTPPARSLRLRAAVLQDGVDVVPERRRHLHRHVRPGHVALWSHLGVLRAQQVGPYLAPI